MKKVTENLAVYQAKDGSIELHKDFDNETVWANLDQIASFFGRDKSVISRHIKNIFKEKELDTESTVAFFAIVQNEGSRKVERNIEFFNLDLILSVGYRVNSKVATQFRIWANKILKEHIVKGFTINPKRIKKNHQAFLKAIEEVKSLAKNNDQITTDGILDLVKSFSYTWFSLDKYDKNNFPKKGNKKTVKITAKDFLQDLESLKKNLLEKKEATELFAQEKNKGNLEGIFGNVFQSVFGKDIYETIEEKSAHLLYFIVKNHPFNDGNKRSGAFAFIWFLQKADFNFQNKISPETLVALTILIAESNPKDKKKMVGIILLLLNFEK